MFLSSRRFGEEKGAPMASVEDQDFFICRGAALMNPNRGQDISGDGIRQQQGLASLRQARNTTVLLLMQPTDFVIADRYFCELKGDGTCDLATSDPRGVHSNDPNCFARCTIDSLSSSLSMVCKFQIVPENVPVR